MKFIKYLIFFIILQGCSSNYEWGWYILSPNNIDGLIVLGGDGSLTGAKIFVEEFNFKVMNPKNMHAKF